MSRDVVFSVEAALLAEATSMAAREQQTVGQLMQTWLAEYVEGGNRVEPYRQLMGRIDYVRAPHQRLNRDELNER